MRSAVALLATALLLDLLLARPDPDLALAQKLLGEADRLDLEGPPAFRAGDRAVLFFEAEGMEGPIRGAVFVDGDEILEVTLLRSREGIDRTAMRTPSFLESFRGKPASPPVFVEGVSGATVSSHAIVDAVNDRLKQWRSLRGE